MPVKAETGPRVYEDNIRGGEKISTKMNTDDYR
jgi:hypothetical protein